MISFFMLWKFKRLVEDCLVDDLRAQICWGPC